MIKMLLTAAAAQKDDGNVWKAPPCYHAMYACNMCMCNVINVSFSSEENEMVISEEAVSIIFKLKEGREES